ncbi:hypothetical protein Scep_005429 [Stephania cephalantha]|uniref:Ribulose bisphosphate carboxylase/oxygenase activase AAA helical domain-containing protein n=1 Tax=Stephania cephalantha TaxID=152367 RepID=A0AAP0KV71_9MAGN
MASAFSTAGSVNRAPLSLPGTGAGASVPSSAFWGSSLKKVNSAFTLPKPYKGKFYWAPTREDRIGVCKGIFRTDSVPDEDIVYVKLVDTFPGQSIDFFGALRARVYHDEVRKWIAGIGVENVGRRLEKSRFVIGFDIYVS